MQFPRLKPEIRPRRLGDGQIRVRGLIYGLGAVIEDPTGQVWELLELLDGTRSEERIKIQFLEEHPAAVPSDVEGAIRQLIAAGLLEDAHDPCENLLTRHERERYSRSRSYFSWVDHTPRTSRWYAQLILRRSSLVIIGVGGTGGSAALSLAASGIGRMHLIDPDIVELSNLNRQILYREADIGRSKVKCAAERLTEMNPLLHVTYSQHAVTCPDDIAQTLIGKDCLILGADKPATIRSWVNRACIQQRMPWVHGGYLGPQVLTGVFVPGTGACQECIELEQSNLRKNWPQRYDLKSYSESSQAATAVSATVSGQYVANAVIRILTGVPDFPVNRLYANSLVRPEHSFALGGDTAVPGCPACANTDEAAEAAVCQDSYDSRHSDDQE